MRIYEPLRVKIQLRFNGHWIIQSVMGLWICIVVMAYYAPGTYSRFAPLVILRDKYVTAKEGDDFLANLDRAQVQEPWDNAVRGSSATINNRYMEVLHEHPPAVVSFPTELVQVSVLHFSIAMISKSWDKGGDGVLFKVSIQEEVGGPEREVFSQYINPKANETERIWHDREIDLSLYRGKKIAIKFITDVGPSGDGRWDSAVWGEPRLVDGESEER